MTECEEREQTRKVKAKYFFSYTQILGEKKSISLSLSLFIPLQRVYTHGWSWAASPAALRSFSLLGSFRVRSCWLSFDAIQKKKMMPEHTHTHTAHSKGDEEKMDSLIFIQKKEYTDSSSSSMPVQAAKEEKNRLLGLAWLGLLRISLFFSLSSFFFFTFASP